MKKLLSLVAVFALVLANGLSAQSVKVVPALDGDGNAYINSLITEMIEDTLEDGSQAHDIYMLKKGAVYIISQKLVFHNPMVIVGEAPTADSAIAQVVVQKPDWGMLGQLINTYADLTIKNVYFHGIATDNTSRVGGNLIVAKKPKLRIHLDGIGWDYMGWSSLQLNQDSLVVILENVHVRNNTRPSGVYCPWTMSFADKHAHHNIDTLIVRNCTIFNQLSFLFKGRFMYFNYLEIDHNSFVNTGKWPFHYHWYRDAKITNNLFYNVDLWGDKLPERQGQDPDLLPFGIINVDTLPGNLVDTLQSPYTIPENERNLVLKNNCYYWSQAALDYYDTQDSVQCDVWMNSRTAAMFADDANYPGLVEENTYNEDPGFTESGPDVILDWVKNARSGGAAYLPGWEPDKDVIPDYYMFVLDWPIPEDLTYSANLVSTDGFHVGDLNWYPDELAEYNPTAIETEIENTIPQNFALEQNYPNPFNPTTTIKYFTPKNGNVKISVYNVLGQQVKVLVDGNVTAGEHTVTLNAGNLASGVYIYRMEAGNFTSYKKMILMK